MASGKIEPQNKTFITKSYTYTGSSGAPGVYWNVSRTNFKMTVPEGYTPFSFTSYYTGSDMIAVSRIQPRNTGTVASFKNVGTGNGVTPTFRLTVTYVPEEMVEDVSGKYSAEFKGVVIGATSGSPLIKYADFMFADPVTRLKIDKLFFAPDEDVCVSVNKDCFYDNKHATLFAFTKTEFGDSESTYYYTKASDFSAGRYYKTFAMPSKSITMGAHYAYGYMVCVNVTNCSYAISPSKSSLVYDVGTEVTVTFTPAYGYNTISITSSVELELVSTNVYKFTMPSEDVSIDCTFTAT